MEPQALLDHRELQAPRANKVFRVSRVLLVIRVRPEQKELLEPKVNKVFRVSRV